MGGGLAAVNVWRDEPDSLLISSSFDEQRARRNIFHTIPRTGGCKWQNREYINLQRLKDRFMYTTRKTMLKKLQDCDDISWSNFYHLYWPFVFAIGSRLGMMEEDCKDLMQEIMITLFNGKEILRYDASKGKFRTYFGQIVCHKALKMLRELERSSSFLVPAPDSADGFLSHSMNLTEVRDENHSFQKIFDEEYNNYLLTLALNELRNRVAPETYDIFEMVVLQERPSKEVARHLGVSRAVIDTYCSRCRKSLQKIISDIRIDNPEFNPEFPS